MKKVEWIRRLGSVTEKTLPKDVRQTELGDMPVRVGYVGPDGELKVMPVVPVGPEVYDIGLSNDAIALYVFAHVGNGYLDLENANRQFGIDTGRLSDAMAELKEAGFLLPKSE